MKTSIYGSELVAFRITVEMIMEYCHKFWMLGDPILEMSIIYGDNMSLITNASILGGRIKRNTMILHITASDKMTQ